jgi:hypothetical protein
MSSTGWVNRVNRSEIFAPYRTDSNVGSRTTWISGRQEEGMYLAQKKVRTHINTGVAGKKNCEVAGMRMAARYAVGIRTLSKRESMM